jgi:maleylpyruvate isomerase
VTVAEPTALPWVHEGSDRLMRVIEQIPDEDLAAPSALPGWSRRHVLAHVGFNAKALSRLVSWARTGQKSPMYASKDQRAGEIQNGSGWAAERLRQFVADTADELARDLDALEPSQWTHEVVTAQGRTVAAREIPWLRARELGVHAVDLDVGVGFRDLSVGLAEALVADVSALRSARSDGPALILNDKNGRTWSITGRGEPTVIHGDAADLAQWLTGRGKPPALEGTERLDLPPWI